MHSYLHPYIQESLRNIWIFKLRSALTLLGMLVGTASVVALISSGQLATQQALDQFKNLGTDLFAVTIEDLAPTSEGHTEKLTVLQVDQIKKSSPAVITAAPYTAHYAPISYNGKLISGNIIGATEALSSAAKITTEKGRFLSLLDGRQSFCVIGSDIAKEIIGATPELIGQQIQIGQSYCTIVGVAKPWAENMFMYAEINRAVLIPIEASFDLGESVKIRNILFKLVPGSDIDQAQKKIEAAINQLLPKAKVFSHSARQLIEGMQKQRRTFSLMLGAIGGISLVVAGIGVMNIMLVSVVERRREIGIRMALGAKNSDIQAMFLTEAVLLTLLGGILGILIGILASWVIALSSHWPFQIYLLPPLIGCSVAALVGIISGYYPAYKAAQLDPIETLRCD